MDKSGVFICTGCGIGEALDIDALVAAGDEQGAAFCTPHECLCGPEGVAAIHAALDEGEANGVVLAACSSRVKTQEFSFDPKKHTHERVSLREQVVWSHPANDEDTQMLAEDLLKMGIAGLGEKKLAEPFGEELDDTILVVGGGLTGLTASRAASDLGNPVVLLEKASRLGGQLADEKDQIPEVPPYDKLVPSEVGELVAKVEADEGIRVILDAEITKITGQPGQFDVTVSSGGDDESLRIGAIVQATGSRPYDASKLGHLGYGTTPNVITSHELEAMLRAGKILRPSDGQVPGRVLFVQCAGSRDPEHLPYCSSECCAVTLKQAAVIHRDFSHIQPMVVYRDMRTPGQMEHFYLAMQEQSSAMFTRGEVESVSGNGSGTLTAQIKNSLIGEDVALEADLVVLATGMVPNSADGELIREYRDSAARSITADSEIQRDLAKKRAEELKSFEGTEILNLDYRQGPDLPVLKYNFPDSHFICFPYETRRTGIYAAGSVRAPMDSAQSAEDGWGAALKAVQCIAAAKRGEAVHPRAGDEGVPDFFLQRCTQCKRCTEECPFGTLNEDAKGTPELNPTRCRRCGICMGACPERIISFPDYSVGAMSAAVKAMSVPEDYEEKPRILVFMCENDALPALDAAARERTQWNAWMRIIPVRCLGSVNMVLVADALNMGVDGVIMIGCKRGDDYQCHYVKGSELADTRVGNWGETLERLALEPERIEVVELAHNEFHRVPEILAKFAEVVDECGPNPFKGF